MKRFSPFVPLLLLLLALAPIGCGANSSDEEGTRAAPEVTLQTPPSSSSPRHSGGSSEEAQKNARTRDRAKDHGHAQKIEQEAQAAQEAIERVERLQQRAALPLTHKDLEDMAKRQIARTKRLLNPPPGKTVADVIQEIEKEIAASLP